MQRPDATRPMTPRETLLVEHMMALELDRFARGLRDAAASYAAENDYTTASVIQRALELELASSGPLTLAQRTFLRAGLHRNALAGVAPFVLGTLFGWLVLVFTGCTFIAEGEPGESSSSSDGERLPRWPLPSDSSSDATSSTSSPTSGSHSGSATSSTSSSDEDDATSSSDAASSSGGELESSSSDEPGESSSSTDTGSECAHDLCSGGAPLDPACSPCVADVCELDDNCCSGAGWDAICIEEAIDTCGLSCP